MGYIDPHVSDQDFIDADSRLSRQQVDRDHREAMTEGGIDAAIIKSRHDERPTLCDGFRRIPGASRSGAIEPRVRSRMLREEQAGLIELQRDGRGDLIGWRSRGGSSAS